ASDEVAYVNISLLADAAPTVERRMLPDLESIYKYILDERQAVLKQIFEVMTAEAFPVLIHCTAGKDRTGVVSALLLGLAGVDHDTIAEDYALTARYAGGMFNELRAQAAAAGRDMSTYERYLEAKPEAMRNTLAYLMEKYESVPVYLIRIGLTEGQINSLRRQLLTIDIQKKIRGATGQRGA
ncbi:MAG TPA: tyrosine-protein phosphatase, partial [Caldilineaceae bacterium]|nr:tyrosine-protein phosphatase [Caldilineaceae bacterium]